MTPEQLKLAEIDVRWALEAQAERQRLIEAAMGSPRLQRWQNLCIMLGAFALILGQLYTLILFGFLWAGSAAVEARMNTRRLDALCKLLDVEKRRSPGSRV